DQDALLAQLERGELADTGTPPQRDFFQLLLRHLREGVFADPIYGGNRNMAGWKLLGYPGVWTSYSAEEQMGDAAASKMGELRSLADRTRPGHNVQEIAGFDPQRGVAPPATDADIILVGLGV
ncbi:MAG: gluconate 2-dehydrogenase subunit 3 family protein, partial [Caldilineaceae bacterium]|nr:gluconate 2-dehydrogenase subunit 3 family protein [Caldilineaceae bacterium]